ncbi:MAG: PIN domain-containing protein, partial [Acidobacteria bacterium]|nr:PIN domain-containing protein [Acidobacteriota bacterium]
MGTLIDASVLIEAGRGRLDLASLLAGHPGKVGLAAITASEMLYVAHRAAKPEQRSRREIFLEQLLARMPVIAFDLMAARVHARLGAELAASGVRIGAHDLLIAATALATGSQVATRDERSFPLVPGLSVV